MIARERLLFKSVSEVLGNERVGLLLLTDSAEQYQIVMPCDERILYEFQKRLDTKVNSDHFLPEILFGVLHWQFEGRFEIHIDYLHDGEYRAVLCNLDSLDDVKLPLGEAILLHHISDGAIPVMMEEKLYQRQRTPYHHAAVGVSMPVNTISQPMLEAALSRAIESENYELASHLRDELNQRKQNKSAEQGQSGKTESISDDEQEKG